MDTRTLLSLVLLTITLLFSSSSPTSSHAGSIVKNLPGFHGDLPFTMETGYVGIGAEEEVQFFYYFVESQRDPANDPFLVYLTGGPGSSAFYPFFFQIGPLIVNFDNSTYEKLALELNPNAWSKIANILFLDQPAGTGFSYATTYEGSISSDTILARQTNEFIIKWFEGHPKFFGNPLYVTGISYMGLLIPLITLDVYKANERGDQPQLNIKGYAIISPFTDKFSDFNSRLEFSHRVALISDDIYKSAVESCNGNYVDGDPTNTKCMISLQRWDECTRRINEENVLDPYCDEDSKSIVCGDVVKKYLENYGNDKEVQKALHVRKGTVKTFEKTNETIHYRFKKEDQTCYAYDIDSSIIYHEALLLRNCQTLILSGDHDLTFPYVGAQKWIKTLNLSTKSPWNPWFVNNQVAGYQTIYSKNGYSLIYATVKGAGHSIPIYKPEETLFILDKWLGSQSSLSDS